MPVLKLVAGLVLGLVMGSAAPAQAFEGPTEGKGLMNRTVGDIPLVDEIAALENPHLRMRYWEIAPGGVVPVHSHADRPGIIWVQNGTVVEHRSDRTEPEEHGPGSVSVEAEGVSHWWENRGDVTVILIAVDIYEKTP